MPAYVQALLDEIQQAGARWRGYEVQTVFFGGGTPSLLDSDQFAALLEEVRRAFPFASDAEISLESNPGTLTREKLFAYRSAGANRLSIGVQALDDDLLRALGRIHTRSQALEAVELALETGFANINLDLMYGLPGQDIAMWERTVRDALALSVPHLSLYSLIVEQGTEMAVRVAAGEKLPDDEETLHMQHRAARLLAENGLMRYEISNYARAGYECRHNLVYWARGEYLGLGCAAHSLMDGARFSNPTSLMDYLSGKRAEEMQRLSALDELEETVMLSLRTRWGLPLDEYRRLMGAGFERKRPILERMMREGLASDEEGRIVLTQRGMDVLNAVVQSLL